MGRILLRNVESSCRASFPGILGLVLSQRLRGLDGYFRLHSWKYFRPRRHVLFQLALPSGLLQKLEHPLKQQQEKIQGFIILRHEAQSSSIWRQEIEFGIPSTSVHRLRHGQHRQQRRRTHPHQLEITRFQQLPSRMLQRKSRGSKELHKSIRQVQEEERRPEALRRRLRMLRGHHHRRRILSHFQEYQRRTRQVPQVLQFQHEGLGQAEQQAQEDLLLHGFQRVLGRFNPGQGISSSYACHVLHSKGS